MEKHMLLRYAFHFLCISGFKRRLKNLELFKRHCVLQEGRGAWSVEELRDDLELLAMPDFDALQSPAANAFFIRRLPRDQRGGRIPKKHAGRRVAVRRQVYQNT